MNDPRSARARRAPTVWAAVLLAVFGVAAADSLRRDSATFDETAHLAAGLSYLERRDFRMNAEHPPMAKVWAALPLWLAGRGRPDYGSPAWVGSADRPGGPRTGCDQWRFGYETLNGAPRDPRRGDPMRLLVPARLAMLVPALVLGWIVFCWSRELWGDSGALVSTFLYCLCPTMLAHSRLVTTDLPVALGIVATLWTFWRFTRRPVWGRALASAVAVAFAATTKFTALVVGPMVLLVGLLWIAAPTTMPHERRRRTLQLVATGALMVGSVWLGLWCAYGFRFAAAADPGYVLDWRVVDLDTGPVASAVQRALAWKLLPEAWLYGLAYALGGAARRLAYLNGETSIVGWRWYFPEAFALKTPPATLLLLGWAGVVAARAWRRRAFDVGAVALPAVLYLAISMLSRLNIGHRHLAPIYPLLFVLLGGLWAAVERGRPGRRMLLILLAAAAVSFAVATPRYLSYFNVLAGGAKGGARFLLDSNLDWGQDLLRLRVWMDRQDRHEIHLAYFGTGDPAAYGIRYRKVLLVPDFAPEQPRELPENGDLVAVSVNLAHGLYTDDDTDLARELLRRRRVHSERIREWIRLRDEASAAGQPHTPFPDWLVEHGFVARGEIDEIRRGLLGPWLREMEETGSPVARIGDSIVVYRVQRAPGVGIASTDLPGRSPTPASQRGSSGHVRSSL